MWNWPLNNNFNWFNFNKINNNKIVYEFGTSLGKIKISQWEIDEFNDANYQIRLNNVGATCYMNTALMCLLSIPYFFIYCRKFYYLIQQNKENIKTQKFSKTIEYKIFEKMCELCANIHSWNTGGSGIGDGNNGNTNYNILYDFRKLIEEGNPLFKPGAGDAKDLIMYLLGILQDKVMQVFLYDINPDRCKQNNYPEYLFDNRNALLMNCVAASQKQFLDYKNINFPLSTLYDMCVNEHKCRCGIHTYNPQTSNFKIFPLEEVRKYRNMNNKNWMNNNWMMGFLSPNNQNKVTLEDCLEYYFINKTILCGDNATYCNYCKQLQPNLMITKQSYPVPEEQIFILNRGKGIEFNVDTELPEAFCMSEDYGIYYELEYIGIHDGPSSGSGHFWSNVKKNKNGQDLWCIINDELYLEGDRNNPGQIETSKPYIVRYKKIDKARFLEIQTNYYMYGRKYNFNRFTSEPRIFSPEVSRQLFSKDYLYQKYIYDNKLHLDNNFITMNEEQKKSYIYNNLSQKDQKILLELGNAPYWARNAQFVNNFNSNNVFNNMWGNNMFNNMQRNMGNFQNNVITNRQNMMFNPQQINNQNFRGNNFITNGQKIMNANLKNNNLQQNIQNFNNWGSNNNFSNFQNNQNMQGNIFAKNGNNIMNQWSNANNMGMINNKKLNNYHYNPNPGDDAAPAANQRFPQRQNYRQSNDNMFNLLQMQSNNGPIDILNFSRRGQIKQGPFVPFK